MNERIRELAKQAGYDIGPFYTGEDNYQIPHYKDEKLEKFAELIVQECCSRMSQETIRHAGYGYNQYGLHQILQEHFGVEQ